MTNTSKTAAIAAIMLAAMPGVASAQRLGGATVAVVDTARVYRECTACVAAQSQLQQQQQTLQQRAQALATPLQTEAQAIQQAAQAAQAQQGAARTQAEQALQPRIQALNTRQTQAQQEIAGLEQNLRSTQSNVLQQINARMNPIINTVMGTRGANLAVDTEATLAHSAQLDITNDVLAQLNQQLPSVSVTPLPQGQQPAQPGQQPAAQPAPQPQGR